MHFAFQNNSNKWQQNHNFGWIRLDDSDLGYTRTIDYSGTISGLYSDQIQTITSVISSAWVLLNWYFHNASNNTYLYIPSEFIIIRISSYIYISFELLSLVTPETFQWELFPFWSFSQKTSLYIVSARTVTALAVN